MPTRKTLIYIALAAIVLLVLFVAVYFFFMRPSAPNGGEGTPSPFPESGTRDSGGGFPGVEEGTTTPTGEALPQAPPLLSRLWSEPVSAVGFYTPPENGEPSLFSDIRFIERGTGHIYTYSEEDASTERLLSVTIPRIQHADFFANGEKLILQYFSRDNTAIETFVGSIEENVDEDGYVLDGVFFPEGITTMAIGKASDSLAYLERSGQRTSLRISTPENTGIVELYSTPLQSFDLEWLNPNRLALHSASAMGADGISLLITTDGESRVLHSNKGGSHTASVNQDLTYMVFSRENSEENIFLYGKNMETGEEQRFLVSTTAEKCAWSNIQSAVVYCFVPNRGMDSRAIYGSQLGFEKFSDNLWSFNLENGEQELLYAVDLEDFPEIDATEIEIDQNDFTLTFINRHDLTPWRMDLLQLRSRRLPVVQSAQ